MSASARRAKRLSSKFLYDRFRFSNRNIQLLESSLSHCKQRIATLSNRNISVNRLFSLLPRRSRSVVLDLAVSLFRLPLFQSQEI